MIFEFISLDALSLQRNKKLHAIINNINVKSCVLSQRDNKQELILLRNASRIHLRNAFMKC